MMQGRYEKYFDEIYAGPVFIAEKILLSHEPVYGLPWCLNIHGHDHNNVEPYKEGCKHINLAANVCGYTPINLGKLASCLLMPEDEVDKFLDLEIADLKNKGLTAMDIARIMSEFNVSFEMALNRLENLGKISENERVRLDNERIQLRVGKLLRSVGGN